jgi:hypothetical protein
MSETFHAANVQDAVELAQRFKAEGRYDWFRGQVRDWPPRSSLGRIYMAGDEMALRTAKARYALFSRWLRANPNLSHLLDDDRMHEFFAVAQHYGIPTHHIDFSKNPAVAGFFACDTAVPPADGDSCIYCLDTADLLELADSLKTVRKGRIEKVEVNVANLWRLEAQEGVFLYADYNWDVDYPMDRIVFPYTGYPSYPPKTRIYPNEASALERFLDQYFDLEKRHFGQLAMDRVLDEVEAKGVIVRRSTLTSLDGGFNARAFIEPGRITRLPSWSVCDDGAWNFYPKESYFAIGSHVERIMIESCEQSRLERSIAFAVRQALDARLVLRAGLVHWELEGALEDLPKDRLAGLFERAWGMMRLLPFSNEQIAAALSKIAGFVSRGCGTEGAEFEHPYRLFETEGDWIRLALQDEDDSTSAAYASKHTIRNAVGADLADLIRPERRAELEDIQTLLLLIADPSRLFDFYAFVDMFAREVIPSQIVLGRRPALPNPASIRIFGIP